MVRIIFFTYLALIVSCSTKEDRLVRRQIKSENVVLSWYFYSYITSGSPDIISIEKDGVEQEIYRGSRIITDVRFSGKNIIIKVIKPPKTLVDIKSHRKLFFDYLVLIDSSGTYDDLLKIPDPM